jgi:hypothetical protein
MNYVFLIGDLKTQNWTVTLPEFSGSEINFRISFTNGEEEILFNSLSFGIVLYKNQELLSKENWPRSGAKYVTSNSQDFIEDYRIVLEQDESYSLRVWAHESEVLFEKTVVFTIPKPRQPYPSWVWTNKQWTAPTPIPTEEAAEGTYYYWNEASLSWHAEDIPDLN